MRRYSTPRIGFAYWVAISVASVFGANLGDFVSHDLGLGHWRGVPFEALALAGVLAGERTSRRGGTGFYWAVVVLLRTAATNVADLLTHDLKLSSPLIILALSAAMAACARWAGSPAASGTGLPRADARYWLALFLAGTIGTVVGDWIAEGWRFGTLWGSAALAAAAGIALLLRARHPERGRADYWWPILAIRSAGTTVGDLLAGPAAMGLMLGTLTTGVAFIAAAAAATAGGRAADDRSEMLLDEGHGGVEAGAQ